MPLCTPRSYVLLLGAVDTVYVEMLDLSSAVVQSLFKRVSAPTYVAAAAAAAIITDSIIIARVAPPIGWHGLLALCTRRCKPQYLQVARHVGEEKAAAELATREDASAAWGDLSARPS